MWLTASPSGELCKGVTVDEIMGDFVVRNVPCDMLLKDAISASIAAFVDDSIETRLGGVRLPTSIKYTHEVITNLSNLVAVLVYSRHAALIHNCSVCFAPVGVVLDCGVHECSDFAHVVYVLCELIIL